MTSLGQQDESYSCFSSSTNHSDQNWICRFCSWNGHEYYLEIPEDYIDDQFNTTGLSAIVPYFDQALEMILDMGPDIYQEEQYAAQIELLSEDEEEEEEEKKSSSDDGFWKERPISRSYAMDPEVICKSAVMLYGLIHQRYLLTNQGQHIMAERYAAGHFGYCPRVYCGRCPVIPCGRYDQVGKESVRLYCPRCMDLYNPENPKLDCVDGAHFGSTYLHLLFLTYPQLVPAPKAHIYQPRIFGFRINESSLIGPQMQWLRKRPLEYLDDDSDSNDDEYFHSEEEDDPLVYDELTTQFVPSQAEDINQIEDLSRQTEDWRIRDSRLNQFFRQFL
ncbi:casein kinase 2 regulatory subunit [Apophysomyces ossiformis]|uniref:Casein kinase II subunit beta n=1 Tax=Apophysomyces ossiformis TaxID=679940 RepID=A0A8H7BN19_9FUNG|nr:casein kinase 2 regulatory subunit [Apophysomyces ossiformis]